MEDLMDSVDAAYDDVVAEHSSFRLTTTRALPMGNPSFAQWQTAIEWAQKVEKASPFWIGDLLLYGDKFGEEASQVLEASAYAEQSKSNAKWTCQAIEPARRKPDVPFSHHAEVAALPPVEQDHWLEKCQSENLTREQLRVQLKAAKAQATGTPVELWLLVRCTDVADQENLAERMKLEGRSVKMQAKTEE